MVQKYVWSEISQLDMLIVNIVLDELMRTAVDGGIGSARCEVAARTVATLSSINVRGRIFSKLRKVKLFAINSCLLLMHVIDFGEDFYEAYPVIN